jgi:hypothetical protein
MPVAGTNDRYLRSEVAIPIAYEKMEPNLIWGDIIKNVKEESNAFIYQYDSTGKSSDSKKKTPPPQTIGGKFPELDISRPTVTSGLLDSNGFSIRLTREVIRQAAGRNEIMRAYETAGFWLAEWINNAQITAMTGGATTPTWTPTTTWDSATATPVEDLRKFKYCMRREGYPYRLTDVYIHVDNYSELEGYLASLDVNAPKQQSVFGMPASGDSVYIPIAGANIHGLDSGITEGYVFGMDRNNPGAETHYYVDPQFSIVRVPYSTIVNGSKVSKSVPNIGIHFSQYTEDDTHDTVMQFWVEQRTVVNRAYALLYDSGI